MARLKIGLVFVLVILAFGTAQAQMSMPMATETAQAAPVGVLVYNAWVRPTAPALTDGATAEAPMPGTTAGAYLTIENTSSGDYQLVSIASGLAEMTMLHQTTIDSNGVARMQMVTTLDVPAGQTVTFAPGGYHVMLMNVAHDVYPGDAVALTLTFADKTGQTFTLPVAALAQDDPPPDDTMIAANAVATTDPVDAKSLDVSLVLDNHGDADSLTGAVSTEGTPAIMLRYLDGTRIFPYTSLDIPARTQTPFVAPDGVFVRIGNLTKKNADAFALTLTFESGRSLTVAVPVVRADS